MSEKASGSSSSGWLARFYEEHYSLFAVAFAVVSTVAVPAIFSEKPTLSDPVRNLGIALALLLVERAIKISRRLGEQSNELKRLQVDDFVGKQVLGSIQDAGILTTKVGAIMNLSSPGQKENAGADVAVLMLRNFVSELLTRRIRVTDGVSSMELFFKDNSLLAYQCCWDALIRKQSLALQRREFRPKQTVARALHCVDPRVWSTSSASEGKDEILNRLFDQQSYFVRELSGKICRLMIGEVKPRTKEFENDILPVLVRMRESGIDIAYIWHENGSETTIVLPPVPSQGFVWVDRFRFAQGWRYRRGQEGIPIELTEVIWGQRDRQAREIWRTWLEIYERLKKANDERLYLLDNEAADLI